MKKAYSVKNIVIIAILMSILGVSIFGYSCSQKNEGNSCKDIGLDAFPPDGAKLAKDGGGEGNFFEFLKKDSLKSYATKKDDSVSIPVDSFEKHPGSKGEFLDEGNIGIHGNSDENKNH